MESRSSLSLALPIRGSPCWACSWSACSSPLLGQQPQASGAASFRHSFATEFKMFSWQNHWAHVSNLCSKSSWLLGLQQGLCWFSCSPCPGHLSCWWAEWTWDSPRQTADLLSWSDPKPLQLFVKKSYPICC